MDLFAKFVESTGNPIATRSRSLHGAACFPRLVGDIGSRMMYKGVPQVVWSLNNYLGLAGDPAVRAADIESVTRHGLSAPMGSRMMSGDTEDLEALETELADFCRKPAALFLNYGYQGMISLIDALLTRQDWLVYDSAGHACILDGVRLRNGRVRAFRHNDVERLADVLARIERERAPDEAVLVVTEGVFGMSGAVAPLRDIVALKQRYDFRLLVDDAHGFGVMGPTGGGTGEAQGVHDGIDLYFATFAKAGASIGAFVASSAEVVWRLRYTMRSQIFAKSLPWPIVASNRVRLDLIRSRPELRRRCWTIAEALQSGLRERGMEVRGTASPITPVHLAMTVAQAGEYVEAMRLRHGVFCSAVSYPVVPPDVVQLRLVPTAVHDLADVAATLDAIPAAYAAMTGRPLPLTAAAPDVT
ncbi:aminotransferase class I/II-fold pyridoxal phosphate-dependent enzyme [Streptomyces sp. AV19]|uniref:aminotransferase class I/II-fold pyridoxal phosphate-dependent enzyme n=1 Tax=Streptomyces sp. AV19 TaxID=2793068 RepID=UPI0024132469|nr:aminotransferase class I/II-fold pyridoxal phosphate-dependent enzyme [Streptomyces sp. AV19]MDG4536812.1 aminotransferase class I/II-fold pyridoxal phosphate-dependent enzyme [Streptomyces sp. AV19]